MRSHTFFYIACTTALAALLMWMGFGILVWRLQAERGEQATSQAASVTEAEREKSLTSMRAALRETRAHREQLEELVQADVLTAASTIEAAGTAAGVKVTIGGAVSSSLSTREAPGELRSVAMAVEATGRLPALLQLVELFETLPFPAVIETLDFDMVSDEAGKAPHDWRMNARIRVITTSKIGT